MAPIQVFVQTRRPHRSHGYYCAICPFSSGGNIIQKKTRPCAQGELVPRGAVGAFAAVLSLIVVIKFQRLLKSSR